MNTILRPLSEDGNIGYDEFDQLILKMPHPREKDWSTMRPIMDLRERTCSICGQGWDLKAESWDDSMSWNRYDEMVHESCMVRFCALRDRDTFFRHFVDARVRFAGMEPLPNGYHSSGRWAKRPWYKVSLLDHPVDFIIGLRKRVVNIEAHPRGDSTLDWWEVAQNAFAEEDVTKGFSPTRIHVHAWNEAKEKDYVRWLVKAGQLQDQR